ncbi:hypothetical protein [Kluyvera sichuanensis]
MARTVEQIEHQLVQARRERDAWQKNHGALPNGEFVSFRTGVRVF